jgi:hypothetical protein
MKICYWSISWGQYSYILQSLLKSFKDVGMQEDFHVFSDIKLKYAENHNLIPTLKLDRLQFFKFHYLKEISKLDYDVFVFIDADHFFVRKPEIEIKDILSDGSSWHSFLESPINSYKTQRQDWWGIKNHELELYFKDLGVVNQEIRNTNGGFWICKKDFIKEAFDLAFKCHNYLKSKNHIVPEEVSIGYISHIASKNIENRFAEKYFNYWASDWTSNFNNSIPKNRPWEWVSYMTMEKFIVNPAIIHGMRSKNSLIEYGKKVLTN